MKRIYVVFAVTMALIFCCVPGGVAGKSEMKSVPGGWHKDKVTPDVKEALDFVLKQMNTSAKLDKIISVKKQVVAGMNYDIDFRLDNKEVWNVKVFRNLSGKYSMKDPATLETDKDSKRKKSKTGKALEKNKKKVKKEIRKEKRKLIINAVK